MSITEKEATGPIDFGGGCKYSTAGRGDCEHFVGLPGYSQPGQHDGPDDRVDVYGKPNGWCWQCWKSYQIGRLQAVNVDLLEALEGLMPSLDQPFDAVAACEQAEAAIHRAKDLATGTGNDARPEDK